MHLPFLSYISDDNVAIGTLCKRWFYLREGTTSIMRLSEWVYLREGDHWILRLPFRRCLFSAAGEMGFGRLT